MYNAGNYIQYPVINHNGKKYKKEKNYVYVYVTESPWYTAEINTTLEINFS